MNKVFLTSSIIAAVLSVVVHASPAAAQTQVSCSTAVNSYLDAQYAGSDWLDGIGVRVTAHNFFGFSSFIMADGYQVATHPLHTPAAAARSQFIAGRNGSDAYSGYFHEVFPGRGNGDVDRWQIWVGRGGYFWLRSVTWNGSWQLLQNVTCYSGPQSQIVVTARSGDSFWSFVMRRQFLI